MIQFLLEEDAIEPRREQDSAGFDFFVKKYSEEYEKELLELNKDSITIKNKIITILPHRDIKIPSGVRTLFDKNIALIAQNKSGIATKTKLLKTAQVIDHSYRGDIIMCLFNFSEDIQTIEFSQKIVQFVPFYINIEEHKYYRDMTIEDFYKGHTDVRGENAFGSTGIH
jgi:dUTPase